MTNIIQTLLTVTTLLTTNVTETDNHRGCSICDGIRKNGWAIYCACGGNGPYTPATERTITTTVTRDTTYEFDVIGCHRVLKDSTVVTNWTRHLRIKSDWEEYQPTNVIGWNSWPPGSPLTNWGPISNIVCEGSVLTKTNLLYWGWTNRLPGSNVLGILTNLTNESTLEAPRR